MARMLPPVTCYAGGDYIMRPIGRVMEVVVHYADSSLLAHARVCPDSITERRACKQCPNDGGGRSFLLHCWDYRSKRFAHCLVPAASWTLLSAKYAPYEGLVPDGPDVIMQRAGPAMEFEIGSSGPRPWDDGPIPDLEGSAMAMASKSVWIKYDRASVESRWPRQRS